MHEGRSWECRVLLSRMPTLEHCSWDAGLCDVPGLDGSPEAMHAGERCPRTGALGTEEDMTEFYTVSAVVVVYLALQLWILPALGIST